MDAPSVSATSWTKMVKLSFWVPIPKKKTITFQDRAGATLTKKL